MIESLKNSIDIGGLIATAIPVVLTLLVCLITSKIIRKLISKLLRKTSMEKNLVTFLERTIKVVFYFIIVLIIADMLEIPVTSLLATFSVVGLAASLAIQDALGNLASGVMILATKPFKNGDYVDGGGVSGTVSEINFSHTLLITPDNKQIHVPNKQIINSTIVNYSEQQFRRVDISYTVVYDNDSNKVKEIMNNAVNAHPKVLKDQPIFVKTTAYKDSGVEYTLRVWVKSSDYWEVYFDLLEGIKEMFDANSVSLAYNRMEVHLIEK